MQPLSPHDDQSSKPLLQRLDRAFADINAFLIVLAIGLATLDVTFFAATRYVALIEHMPPVTQTAPAAASDTGDTSSS